MTGGDEQASLVQSGDSPPSRTVPRRPALHSAGRPPGPRGRRFAGTLYDYEKDPIGYLTSCRDTYGDIFRLTPYHVVVCRPEWSQQVLGRTNREFLFAPPEGSPRESFITHQIAGWMLARRSAGWRRLGQQNTAAEGNSIHHQLSVAFKRMAVAPAAGVADCQRAAADATLHIFVADIDDGLRQLVVDAADAVPAISSSSLTLPLWASPARRRFMRATDGLIGELADRAARRAGMRDCDDSEPRDMLDLICRVQGSSGAEHAFTSIQMAQFIASAMSNAYAVAGAALSWLLVAVARHPEIMSDPVRSSLRAGGPPETGQRAEAFVKETLRVYPPIWNLVRRVRQPVELGGYTFEPGMSVLTSPKMMHLDPRWWREDPATFRPERWLDPRRPPHDNHAYIPYGAGPRVCIGAQIAQAVLTHAFGILSAWQVAIDPPAPAPVPNAVVVPGRLGITLTPR
jgi:unspecific monooxygenase